MLFSRLDAVKPVDTKGIVLNRPSTDGDSVPFMQVVYVEVCLAIRAFIWPGWPSVEPLSFSISSCSTSNHEPWSCCTTPNELTCVKPRGMLDSSSLVLFNRFPI